MKKYAVIQLGGKQFKVEEGNFFEIERQKKLDINVLFYFDGEKSYIGTPTLEDVEINAEIIENKLGKKIDTIRFKSKSRYKKRRGHRQPLSVVKINKISKKKSTSKKVKKESK